MLYQESSLIDELKVNVATDTLLPSNENMKKIIFLSTLFFLVACGPSDEEKQNNAEKFKIETLKNIEEFMISNYPSLKDNL